MDFLNDNFEYKFDYVDNFDSIDNSKLDLYSFIIFNNAPYEKLNINLIQLKEMFRMVEAFYSSLGTRCLVRVDIVSLNLKKSYLFNLK